MVVGTFNNNVIKNIKYKLNNSSINSFRTITIKLLTTLKEYTLLNRNLINRSEFYVTI